MRAPDKSLLQRVPGIMMPLLVMAFSASLAKLGWMVFAPPQDVSAAPIIKTAEPVTIAQAPNFGRIIADNHLFGEVKRIPTLAKVAPKTTPKPVQPPKPAVPPLALNLHGLWAKKKSDGRTEDSYKATPVNKDKNVVSQIAMDLDSLFNLEPAKEKPKLKAVSTKKSKAFAIMSHSGGDQQMYSEGESIAEDVKVIEIFADKVVIENRGVRQEIFLSDGKSLASTDSPSAPLPASVRQPARPRTIPKAVSASIAAGQQQQVPSSMSNPRRGGENLGQRDLRKLREDVTNDASLLSQYSAPEPLLMDGAVKGFRLHLSNRLRLLYQVGFRPGDVVTELNGVRLNDPATVQQALYNFIGSDQMSISVMRGQNEETFRYNFDG
jgi:general secretion pathway protein C